MYVIRKGESDGENDLGADKTIVINGRDLRKLSGYEGKTINGGLKANPVIAYLLKMRQAFPFVYLTDDGGKSYRAKAFTAACQLIEQNNITTLFSSFRPWSDHLVARQLKARYPHLRWIADFRDLPVDPVRKDVWWPGLQSWWGKKMVASADEVWAVSGGQKVQLTGWHSAIKVVRNPLLALPPAKNNPVTARFTIAYTGSLYPGLQTVAPLVVVLRNLLAQGTISPDKLCLQYRGKDTGLFRQWVGELPPDCLDIAPAIAPAAAQKMQREAQLLLLLNWSAPGYYGVLTAKLWDYLATGRPVLALVNGPEDPELHDIITGADAGAVFSNEAQGLAAWLRQAYAQWLEGGSLPWSVDRAALEQYL